MDLFINGHNVNEIKEVQYIMVHLERNVWGAKIKIKIDIGRGVELESKITDSKGEEIALVSEVDYLNDLHRFGWKYEHSQATTSPNGMPVIKQLYQRI